MKSLISLAVIAFLFMVGCSDNNSTITSPESGYTQLSNEPNWVKLPADIKGRLGIETEYSASKLIKGKDGGDVKLNIKIKRPGNPLGDFEVHAKLKIEKHSFPDQEERLFTLSLDPDYAVINVSPSPNTLQKHVKIDDAEIKGIDVSDIDEETFDFIYVGDNSEILETAKEELTVDYNKNKIKVKKAVIDPYTVEMTPPGSRYGWVR